MKTLLRFHRAIAILALAAEADRPTVLLTTMVRTILPVLPNLYTFFLFSTVRESLDHLQAAVFA